MALTLIGASRSFSVVTENWTLRASSSGFTTESWARLRVVDNSITDSTYADGIAIIRADRTQEWLFNGDLHRLDGPAIIGETGSQWWVNGKLHRSDGPAVVEIDGSEEWWFNSKRHRSGGPAVIRADGSKEWWINGVEFTEEVHEWMEHLSIKPFG